MSRHSKVRGQRQPPSIPPCQGGSSGSLPDKGGRGEGWRRGEDLTTGVGFLPYNKNLTELARQNRKNPTQAELTFWDHVLRKKQFAGFKFLRQKPIGGYIVDFYCSELRLVIEIDGESHAEMAEYDNERTRFLNSFGLHVWRYTNEEVLQNLEGVYDDLTQKVGYLLE